jgi:hypothetical protein
MRNKIWEYLTQALLIIFSVVLALALNEYRGSRLAKQELQRSLNLVKQEIEANQHVTRQVYTQHQKMVERIDSLMLGDSLIKTIQTEFGPRFSSFTHNKSLLPRMPSKAAWEALKLNPSLAENEFKLFQALTATYDQQELTFEPVFEILDLVTSHAYFREELAKHNLYIISAKLEETVAREQTLLNYYDQTLAILEAQLEK